YRLLEQRGATMAAGLERRRVEGGRVAWFDITTPFGDTLFRFMETEGEVPVLPDLERVADSRSFQGMFSYGDVDHITSNFLTMQPALSWMRSVLGLEQLWDISFHSQDLGSGHHRGSGLKSIVMYDPESGIKFANN